MSASSTYEETVTRLGTAIRIGVLAAGTRLPPERELAEQLRISRSTLRQALATLTATGHLRAVRGRAGGTFVSDAPPLSSGEPFPRDRVAALLDRRVALELGIVQLAAERAGDAAGDRLTALAAAFEESVWEGDFSVYRRADAAFHLGLAEAAGSPGLVAALARLQGQLSDVLVEAGVPRAAREQDVEHHRRIMEAVQHGDPAEAVAAMRGHLEATEQMLSGSLR